MGSNWGADVHNPTGDLNAGVAECRRASTDPSGAPDSRRDSALGGDSHELATFRESVSWVIAVIGSASSTPFLIAHDLATPDGARKLDTKMW